MSRSPEVEAAMRNTESGIYCADYADTLAAEVERLEAHLKGAMQDGGYEHFTAQLRNAQKQAHNAIYVAQQLEKKVAELEALDELTTNQAKEYLERAEAAEAELVAITNLLDAAGIGLPPISPPIAWTLKERIQIAIMSATDDVDSVGKATRHAQLEARVDSLMRDNEEQRMKVREEITKRAELEAQNARLRESLEPNQLAVDCLGRLAKLLTQDDGADPEAYWIELTPEEANLIKQVAALADGKAAP